MLLGAIVGATGVGKTELSIRLAQQLGAEIISADSRQIYQGLRIGTAQPTAHQQTLVPHHLIDFLSPSESYSAARYLTDVRAIIENRPEQDFLVVGGTGLYIQVLMEGISETPSVDSSLRNNLDALEITQGLSYLYKWAITLDPALISSLKAGDSHRIKRALELMLQTGRRYAETLGPRVGGFGMFPVLFCDRDRDELYHRINQRVLSMIEQGWIDEVRDLCTRVSVQTAGMQSLGYRQLVSVVLGEADLSRVVPEIQQESRNYAKRQLTWFRNKTPHTPFILDKNGEIDEILRFFEKAKKSCKKP